MCWHKTPAGCNCGSKARNPTGRQGSKHMSHRVFAWQQQTALSFQLRASCSCSSQQARPRGLLLLLLLLPAQKLRMCGWCRPAASRNPSPDNPEHWADIAGHVRYHKDQEDHGGSDQECQGAHTRLPAGASHARAPTEEPLHTQQQDTHQHGGTSVGTRRPLLYAGCVAVAALCVLCNGPAECRVVWRGWCAACCCSSDQTPCLLRVKTHLIPLPLLIHPKPPGLLVLPCHAATPPLLGFQLSRRPPL